MQFIPSPNFWKGRDGHRVKAVVLHCTLGSYEGAVEWLKNPDSNVSAHLVISKTGDLTKMVNYDDSAWHAGRENNPTWKGIVPGINCNRITFGIENEAMLRETWTEPQMAALTMCVKELLASVNLPVTRDTVISHNEIAEDKEDMDEWCKEVIVRLIPPPLWVPPVSVNQNNTLKRILRKILAFLGIAF